MQIKTTRDTTTHLSESLLPKRQEMYVGENVKKIKSLCIIDVNVKWLLKKTVWQFHKNIKVERPQDLAIPPPGLYRNT